MEIANIENISLRERFLNISNNLLSEQLEKEQQVYYIHFYNFSKPYNSYIIKFKLVKVLQIIYNMYFDLYNIHDFQIYQNILFFTDSRTSIIPSLIYNCEVKTKF